ncbi:MAG: cell division ATPase MinD [Candidatus Micrarchaeota archaeon]
MRSIVIASGKGGVGKTSIAVNLGLVLAQQGKRTVVVDADVSMANVGIMLGIERAPISLHNVLMGETSIRDAVYEGPYKLKYVPSSLSLERVKRLSMERLKQAVEDLEPIADFVIIDSPPSLTRESEFVISSAREMLLVVTPDPASLADALKVINYANKNGVGIMGIVVNMSIGDKNEVKKDDIETLLSSKVLVVVPEDIEMRRAAISQVPLVIKNPQAPSAKKLRELAAAITGEAVKDETKVKKSLLQKLIDFLTGKKQ